MARIPYAKTGQPETMALETRITAERGKIFNLYAMLLNSAPVAEGWLNFLTAIRQKSSLPADVRELLIMRVAVLNEADYEFAQHMPFALRAGFTEAQMEQLRTNDLHAFNDRDQALIAYCDAMTREIRVPDQTFEAIRPHFNNQEMVEVTATVGAYNMVSRFLEALQIDHD